MFHFLATLASAASIACGGESQASGRKGADCEDTEIRLQALTALQTMQSDQFLPTLKRLYDKPDSCSTVLRRRALETLASYTYSYYQGTQEPDPELTAIITTAATTDPDAEVRKKAIGLLQYDKSDAAAQALGKALASTTDEEVQQVALSSLSQRYVPGTRKYIRDFAIQASVTEEMRSQAVQTLGYAAQNRPEYPQNDRGAKSSAKIKEDWKLLQTESAGYLREIYPKLETQALKQQVIGYIAQFGGEDNMDWVAGLAAGTDELETRRTALSHATGSSYGWGYGGSEHRTGPLGARKASAAKLVAIYDLLRDRSLKQTLVSHYAQQKDDVSFEKLVAIAKGDKDTQTRNTAVSSLSQSKHPKAKEALAGIVSQ